MTRKEHLFTCLMEECSEVIKLASKCNRFGVKSCHPVTKRVNEEGVQREFIETYAVIQMIQNEIFDFRFDANEIDDIIEEKQNRVNHYIECAMKEENEDESRES